MLMGLLPTYAQIGVWAPILLVLLRVIQGFALGGESTGAQLMALEHANPQNRGKYSGYLGMCSPLSQILANAVLLLLSSTLSPADFESYGWRIPFLLSFVLVLVGHLHPAEGQRDAGVHGDEGGRRSEGGEPAAAT